MTAIVARAVGVTAVRYDLKLWTIINIGSIIILWWSLSSYKERQTLWLWWCGQYQQLQLLWQTDGQTWELLKRPDPEGWVGENGY